jgi:uncharacterized protein (TIGR02145 family)
MHKSIRNVILGLLCLLCILLGGCKKAFLPIVITEDIGYYTSCHASFWGKTISEGGVPISERGICLSTNEKDSFTCNIASVVDKGDKLFLCILGPLKPNTTYYFKAYAINAVGTSYGEIKSFTTKPPEIPTLTTLASATSPTEAIVEGKITTEWCSNYMERGVCWSTNPNPDITGNKIVDGALSDSFTVKLSGLTSSTKYYVRTYASSSAGTGYGNQIIFSTLASNSVQDVDGNYYDQINIGTQVWLKENLRTTKYRDGSIINKVTGAGSWFSNSTTPLYGENFTNSTDLFTYGRIYNSYAVLDSRKLCPVGWHIPGDSEWNTLVTFLGGAAIAGGKLKETSGWPSDPDATNESGFSAFPGRYPSKYTISPYGTPYTVYNYTGDIAYWWSSDLNFRRLIYNNTTVFSTPYNSSIAPVYSIRCIKDN